MIMSLELVLYLVDVVTGVKVVLVSLLVVTLAALFSATIVWYLSFDESEGDAIRKTVTSMIFTKINISLFILLLSLVVAIPDKATMYTIMGVHYGKQVASGTTGNTLLDKSYKLLELKIDSLLEDTPTKTDKE